MGKEYFIGLMSGTSLDAIDAVVVSFEKKIQLIDAYSEPISASLKQSILDLCQPGSNEIDRMGELDVELGEIFAQSCLNLLKQSGLKNQNITAIGSHGQTIRHRPKSLRPFTLQIGDPHIIAARTGIQVIADFRRRDMALGGQGAPLAPAFHQFLLHNPAQNSWALNIGGIANITWLPANLQEPIIGFDTGPGNTLLDSWCFKHTKQPYDKDGQWAAQGKVHSSLLKLLLEDQYFKMPAPKSTGREYFNLSWLEAALSSFETLSPADIQATLLELTAQAIINSIHSYSKIAHQLWVCGGGAHNHLLMHRLVELAPELLVTTTDAAGISPDWIEASAWAWLARETVQGRPGNIPSVTGAQSATILGAIYPAYLPYNI